MLGLKSTSRVAACALLLWCSSGCKREPEPKRRTEPWLAHPSSSAGLGAYSAPLTLHFAPGSSVRFSLPTRHNALAGQVPVTSGELLLDPNDVSRSRCHFEMDLTRLTLIEDSLPRDGGLDIAAATAQALAWLELGAEVPRERREQFRFARFELSSLEASGSTGLDLSRTGTQRLRVTAIGSVLLHGFRAPLRAQLVLQTPPQTHTGPLELTIRSASPVVLPLAPHDIVARGPGGIPDPLATSRAVDVVGKTVRVEVQLVAQAEPPGHK